MECWDIVARRKILLGGPNLLGPLLGVKIPFLKEVREFRPWGPRGFLGLIGRFYWEVLEFLKGWVISPEGLPTNWLGMALDNNPLISPLKIGVISPKNLEESFGGVGTRFPIFRD